MAYPYAELEQRVRDDMLRLHNVALGVFGIPEGARPTFSRSGFYREACRLGVITPAELNTIAKANATLWDMDLSD